MAETVEPDIWFDLIERPSIIHPLWVYVIQSIYEYYYCFYYHYFVQRSFCIYRVSVFTETCW